MLVASVPTVEQIVEQIRVAAGADFAFVLTRKGRLVTHRAPRDMPEVGRNRLVRAARPLIGSDKVLEITLPREEIVPYGGAAPVDVYLAVAGEQAIVCAVMATWADKIRVAPALVAGVRAMEPLLRRGLPPARRTAADLVPAKGAAWVERPSAFPPPGNDPPLFDSLPPPSGPMPFAMGGDPPYPPAPPLESLPEIHVGEAELGRMSMVAVRHEMLATDSSPEITFSEADLGRGSMVAVRRELIGSGSAPEIVVSGEAPLGRETIAAIDRETKPRPTSTPDAIRVELVSVPESLVSEGDRATMAWGDKPADVLRSVKVPDNTRATLPWVEAPADAKRAADAARTGRKLAPPKVTVKLDEIGDDDERPAKG
jgi:hypothetical protein